MNILITGISGFFGRNFVNYLLDRNPECTIIGTSHNRSNPTPHVKSYTVDLASEAFETDIETIIQNHKINYVIHSAAIKYIDVCQKDPIMALRVNTIASHILVKVAKRNNVKNLIALGTERSNNLSSVYSISKYIMQENVLLNNYSVYQGENFFWSDGSVLDIWFNQYCNKESLSVANPNQRMCFNTIDQVCESIFMNIDNNGIIILPENIYIVKLGDLLNAFLDFFKYDNFTSIAANHDNYILPDTFTGLSKDDIQSFIKKYYDIKINLLSNNIQ